MSRLPLVLVPHPHVRIDQKVLGGSPYVVGSRVPVRRLFSFYRSGTTIEKIMLRYPQLSAAQIFDALAFALDNPEVIAADIEREGSLLLDPVPREPKVSPRARQAEFDFDEAPAEPSDRNS